MCKSIIIIDIKKRNKKSWNVGLGVKLYFEEKKKMKV
jgi:hypothetical protein